MTRLTRIELFKENFKFSAGHFTIFSGTERENIHGHNFTMHVGFDLTADTSTRTFDYRIAKKKIEALCQEFNEFFLVPENSPHLRIEHDQDYVTLHFNGEKIPFLPRDVKLLPVENITIEALSAYMLERVKKDVVMPEWEVARIEVRVFSGPGQSANAVWESAT